MFSSYKSQLIYSSSIMLEKAVQSAFMLGNRDTVSDVAETLRNVILNAFENSSALRWPSHAEHIGKTDDILPTELCNFLKYMFSWKVKYTSTQTNRLVSFIGQDICRAVTNGEWKMPKHILVCMTLRHLYRSKQLTTLLNRLGHCESHSLSVKLETAIATSLEQTSSLLSAQILREPNAQSIFHSEFDNYDQLVNTLTGVGSIHTAHGIMIQEVLTEDNGGTVHDVPSIPRSRERSLKMSVQEELPDCYVGQRKSPSYSVTNRVYPGSEGSLKLAKEKSILWLLIRIYSSAANQEVPGWTGFLSVTGSKPTKLTTVDYYPVINHPITEYRTVQECLRYAEKATTEVEQEYVVTTFDLGVCMKALPLIWNTTVKYQKHIVMIGTFHLICAYLRMVGKKMACSGLSDVMLEAGLIWTGSSQGVHTGKHYDRAMHCHKIVLESLERLLFEQFLHQKGMSDIFDGLPESSKLKIQDLVHSPSEQLLEQLMNDTPLVTYIQEYCKYRDKVCEGEGGKTAQFWIAYMDHVWLVLSLIRAVETNDFLLYAECLHQMSDLFFSFDGQNYARYLTFFSVFVANIRDSHPGATDVLQRGAISVARSFIPGNRCSVEKTMKETFMKHAKSHSGAGGIGAGVTGISSNYHAYQRWVQTTRERSKYVQATFNMADMLTESDSSTRHRDLRPAEIQKSEQEVCETQEAIKGFINPFTIDDKGHLYCISSGAHEPDANENDILMAETRREEAKEAFIKNRLEAHDKLLTPSGVDLRQSTSTGLWDPYFDIRQAKCADLYSTAEPMSTEEVTPPLFFSQIYLAFQFLTMSCFGYGDFRRRENRDFQKTSGNADFRTKENRGFDFKKITDEYMYADKLAVYCKQMNWTRKVTFMPAVGGFAGTLEMNGTFYGSEGVFPSQPAAQAAAYKTACLQLGIKLGEATQDVKELSVSEESLIKVKQRVKEILSSKANGLWTTRLPVLYKELYKEDPPENLEIHVQKWTDIARAEQGINTDNVIVYPVLEDPNKGKEYVIPKGQALPIGDKIIVYMTFIYSCGHFCVQKKESLIDEIAEELESFCKDRPVPAIDQICKGCYCAAIYSSDNSWSRGEVIECYNSEKSFDVLYVDYGNMEKVSSRLIVDAIRWLSEKAAAYPAEVVYCSLYGVAPLTGSSTVEGDWSDSSKEEFAELVKEKELLAWVRGCDDNVYEIELFDVEKPDVSINEQLIQLALVRDLNAVTKTEEEELEKLEESMVSNDPDPLLLPDGDWDVYVGFVNSSLNHVFVRLVGEEYSEKLEKFQIRLEEIFKSSPDDIKFELGSIYIAYVDGIYHRVQLLAMDDTKWRCLFLDHGDCDELIPDQLKPLPVSENKLLPYQAIEVSLHGLDDIAQDTTALEKLFDTALGLTCVAVVFSKDTHISVVLYDTEGSGDVNLNNAIREAVENKKKLQKKPETDGKATVDLTELIKDINEETSQLSQSRLERMNLDSKGVQGSSSLEQTKIRPSSKEDDLNNESSSVMKSEDIPTKNLYSWDRNEPNSQTPENGSSAQILIEKLEGLTVDSELDKFDVDDLYDPKKYRTHVLPPVLQFPKVGDFMDVHVISISDPDHFLCIPYEYFEVLDELFQKLNDYFVEKEQDKHLKYEDVEDNLLYAGLQGGVWYRVLVTKKIETDLVSVYLVDFGEYTVMSLDELQPLPSKFWQLPFLAFKCKLSGIISNEGEGNWSEAAKFKFIQIAHDRSLVALFCGEDKGQIAVKLVDTSQEDKDVCIDEVLINLNLARVTGGKKPN
ncbi:hypothetical protein ScPMuIL_007952 [Solemya velum]